MLLRRGYFGCKLQKREQKITFINKQHNIINMVRQRKTLEEIYKPYLCRLMAFKDVEEEDHYPRTFQFSQEQLLSITPDHVSRWMKKLAYGTPTPGPTDNPTHCRSSLLAQAKKAISFNMPNKHMPWDVRSNSGNPTRSIPVNDVIKSVKKAEVRKQGRPSCAKRDMKRNEYQKTMRILEAETGNYEKQSKYPTMLKIQFHIIGRTDDITNLETNDLRSHDKFGSFALQTKVSWSKNVMEERDCPDQIILGADDVDFCVLLSFGCYLESRLTGHQQGRFLFGDSNDNEEPDRINARYCGVLRQCWNRPDFQELLAQIRGSLGSHSNRKFPATWCAENGCNDPEVEIRGRWKGKKNGRVVNRYISVEQLTTDAKLAAILAIGGPVRYKLKEDSHVSDQFLYDVVAPKIKEHFSSDASNGIARVLAPPLLWACHEASLSHMISPAVKARVQQGYNTIRGRNPADYNPVVKVPLHVSRVENQVFIEDAITMDAGNGGGGGQAATQADQNQTIILSLHRLHTREMEHHQQNQVNYSQLRNYCCTQFAQMNRSMTRYSMQPVRPLGPNRNATATATTATTNIGGNEGVDSTTKLAAHPRTLLLLWHEYLYGLEGNKAAKDFTQVERGRAKFKYCRRKCFWSVMSRLVNAGFTELIAIDKIHQAYGVKLSVSAVLNKMQRDKKNGGHPNLAI
jgi:hypothetical protein